MGIAIRPEILIREAARRGWTVAELARVAGLSGPTMSAAKAGRRISPRSLHLIVAALASEPPLDGVDALLLD